FFFTSRRRHTSWPRDWSSDVCSSDLRRRSARTRCRRVCGPSTNSPIDGKNLTRVYPGKRDGTVSERIADAITREIIERADYLVRSEERRVGKEDTCICCRHNIR